MAPDVISVVHKADYKLELTFDDGSKGIVDFRKYLSRGGVFERFRDKDLFLSYKVDAEPGVLTWGDEIDIAPETLYSHATGTVLPSWVDTTDDDPTAEMGV